MSVPDQADAIVRAVEDACSPQDAAEQADELVRLGTPVIGRLVQMLVDGRLSSGEELTPRQEEVALEALCDFGRVQVLDVLVARAGEGTSKGLCLVALRVLKTVGQAQDLGFAVKLAEQQREPLVPEVTGALQETVNAIFCREPDSLHRAKTYLVHARLDVASVLVLAIGSTNEPAAAEVFRDTLGFTPALDTAMIAWIGRIAEGNPLPIFPESGSLLREYLLAEDPQLVREAAMAAGRMRSSDSVPLLIDLLSHESPSVREAAYWALRETTGLRLRSDPSAWERWRAVEDDWLRERAPQKYQELVQSDRSRVLLALSEIGRHRLRADELAREVERALEHADPEVRAVACATLGRIRSKRAVLALVGVIEDSDDLVAEAAYDALRTITRIDLPRNPELWQAKVAG